MAIPAALRRAGVCAWVLAWLACSPSGETTTAAARGERVYRNACATCHGPDPASDGPIGPAIAGSSQALLEARLLRGAYPEGYTPKRPSQLMPALPYLAEAIPDLTAYLSQQAR